ncbi:MAG: putative transposase [Akkermansiaceae bacterium]|jgi:putative transposase|tara:strand:- start:1032 stop:1367 length:336 start_codon:yes stop_codon:yes gene_type:complete
MKKKRHKTEEIIRIVRKADGGQTVEEVCREENICVQTFYRWRRKYGQMEIADAKRFKELVNENGDLITEYGYIYNPISNRQYWYRYNNEGKTMATMNLFTETRSLTIGRVL